VDTVEYSEKEIERVVRLAFRIAQGRKKRVTSVDKANVMETSRLWRETAQRVAKEFPDCTLEHMLVDSAAMRLITFPRGFDVIVTENMFGDILTDEAGVLAGSLGMLPSASLGTQVRSSQLRGNTLEVNQPQSDTLPDSRPDGDVPPPDASSAQSGPGLYEPVHGSAPDIAGTGKANPVGSMLSAAMMLDYSLNLPSEARAVEQAVRSALAKGFRTPDLGGTTGTREMAEAVVREYRALSD
jgi:3-isopropylmalate dehydrogenase